MKVHREIVEVHRTVRGKKPHLETRNVALYIKYTGPAEVLDAINAGYLANLAWETPGHKITIEIETRELKR